MRKLKAVLVKEMLLFVCQSIIDSKPLLTEVDSAIGDGDHGIGMELGMKKAAKKLDILDSDDVYEYFRTMGKTMLMGMGGASGVVFGNMFLAGARGCDPLPTLDVQAMYMLFARSLEEIKARGGARIGDKTMVDALEPAVRALGENVEEEFSVALLRAEESAEEGLNYTKTIEAKFGRAKTQGSTIGFQDAGATSVWLIFRAMRIYLEKLP